MSHILDVVWECSGVLAAVLQSVQRQHDNYLLRCNQMWMLKLPTDRNHVHFSDLATTLASLEYAMYIDICIDATVYATLSCAFRHLDHLGRSCLKLRMFKNFLQFHHVKATCYDICSTTVALLHKFPRHGFALKARLADLMGQQMFHT